MHKNNSKNKNLCYSSTSCHLQALVVVNSCDMWTFLLNFLLQLFLQAVNSDGGLLREQCTAKWSRECQDQATEEYLNWGICPWHALE